MQADFDLWYAIFSTQVGQKSVQYTSTSKFLLKFDSDIIVQIKGKFSQEGEIDITSSISLSVEN